MLHVPVFIEQNALEIMFNLMFIFFSLLVYIDSFHTYNALILMQCDTGELLYGWQWHRESIRKFHQVVEKSGASPESLLHLALEHWLQGPSPDTVATLHFGMVVHILSSLAGG